MKIIVYYDGGPANTRWLTKLLGTGIDLEFRKLPTNFNAEFTKLPAYVADILYLDKADFILSGTLDGVHEKPLFSIELASCTPQYQHALQRFSRMMASVTSGCPSAIVFPMQKRDNREGRRLYRRSAALEYGAVRLMDVYDIPTYVFEWPDNDGTLQTEPETGGPLIATSSIQALGELLRAAIRAFENLDYISALKRLPATRSMIEALRTRAYSLGVPTPDRPGGGTGEATPANLELQNTNELVAEIRANVSRGVAFAQQIPSYILNRKQSLIFRPTRVTEHGGDPYVGMIGYYDIAFCRQGSSTRDRVHNLVAYCNGVSIDEINTTMKRFNEAKCPFVNDVQPQTLLDWAHHLRHGCRHTKAKPIRIYSELADLLIFDDGMIVNVG